MLFNNYLCAKELVMNPFYITGRIPETYFCDREAETERLIRLLTNGGNVLLTSPRRMGKTQLIRHLYEQPEIKGLYHTFYIDIYPTNSLGELALFMSKEVFRELIPAGKKTLESFLGALRSISGSFGFDAMTGLPKFELNLGDIRMPELTLEEIFHYLETAEKPCIFAIDEFQQIASYPENNTEALLRSYIQDMSNCHFIFAGSNRHVLDNMFSSHAKPFYNSADKLFLDRIGRNTYVAFALEKLQEENRQAPADTIGQIYDHFEGHTYYIQKILHEAFALTKENDPIDNILVDNVLSSILAENDHAFSDQMAALTLNQKALLIAIAKEKKAQRITSGAFIRKHALASPSVVQNACRTLLEQQIITYELGEDSTKEYSIADLFLREWLLMKY